MTLTHVLWKRIAHLAQQRPKPFSLHDSTASLSLLRFVRSFSACITATVSMYIAGCISSHNHTIVRNRVSNSISWSYAIDTIERHEWSKTIDPRSTCSSSSWTIWASSMVKHEPPISKAQVPPIQAYVTVWTMAAPLQCSGYWPALSLLGSPSILSLSYALSMGSTLTYRYHLAMSRDR